MASLSPECKSPDEGIKKPVEDDPFGAPQASTPKSVPSAVEGGGPKQPPKDSIQASQPALAVLNNRVLSGIQWHATEVSSKIGSDCNVPS